MFGLAPVVGNIKLFSKKYRNPMRMFLLFMQIVARHNILPIYLFYFLHIHVIITGCYYDESVCATYPQSFCSSVPLHIVSSTLASCSIVGWW
jgi:hypothetical protein